MADVGRKGVWTPNIVNSGSLNELRDRAGDPPYEGQKWVMVNLMTGEFKWYRRSKRNYGYSRGYSRGYSGRRYY